VIWDSGNFEVGTYSLSYPPFFTYFYFACWQAAFLLLLAVYFLSTHQF
jgi:hypothetical protein